MEIYHAHKANPVGTSCILHCTGRGKPPQVISLQQVEPTMPGMLCLCPKASPNASHLLLYMPKCSQMLHYSLGRSCLSASFFSSVDLMASMKSDRFKY